MLLSAAPWCAGPIGTSAGARSAQGGTVGREEDATAVQSPAPHLAAGAGRVGAKRRGSANAHRGGATPPQLWPPKQPPNTLRRAKTPRPGIGGGNNNEIVFIFFPWKGTLTDAGDGDGGY